MSEGQLLSVADMRESSGRSRSEGPILFVAGSPRSGTTLVSRMLRIYYDFGMGPEGHWILPYRDRLAAFGDLEDDANARRLIDAILAEEMFQIVRERYQPVNGQPVHVTTDMVWEVLDGRAYPDIVYAVLLALSRALGRSKVGNKNPGFTRHLDTLEALFPDARYLFVVRDGRDVALSMMQQPWGQKSWYANARFWAETLERSQRFQRRLDPERYHEVKYEDLLRDPYATSLGLEDFLGQPISEEARAALVAEIRGGSRSQNYAKWKSRMNPRQHRLYESAAGDWLEHFGYERLTSRARAYPWERVTYMSLEYARRAWGRFRKAIGRPVRSRPTPGERPGGL